MVLLTSVRVHSTHQHKARQAPHTEKWALGQGQQGAPLLLSPCACRGRRPHHRLQNVFSKLFSFGGQVSLAEGCFPTTSSGCEAEQTHVCLRVKELVLPCPGMIFVGCFQLFCPLDLGTYCDITVLGETQPERLPPVCSSPVISDANHGCAKLQGKVAALSIRPWSLAFDLCASALWESSAHSPVGLGVFVEEMKEVKNSDA